ncbi:MAG: C39 family peptidase [Chloroflexi bacterium]|nr:C39 family peptidase [Chloroflexota bacterium]
MRRTAICVALIVASLAPLTAQADELPPSALVEGVVGHPQEHNLSCESRSAADVAAFWGVTFAEDDFFRRLPKSDNPNRGFLGDVDLPPGTMPPAGYGVYAGPVAANLRSFGLNARARREWSLDELKAELAAGRPVIIWATYEMQLPGVQTWEASDGQICLVVQWQHTFIAVGYDETGVYLIDAYDAGTKHFSYEAFVPAWDQLGQQAVTVEGPYQPSWRAWDLQTTDADGRRRFVVDGRWAVGPE